MTSPPSAGTATPPRSSTPRPASGSTSCPSAPPRPWPRGYVSTPGPHTSAATAPAPTARRSARRSLKRCRSVTWQLTVGSQGPQPNGPAQARPGVICCSRCALVGAWPEAPRPGPRPGPKDLGGEDLREGWTERLLFDMIAVVTPGARAVLRRLTDPGCTATYDGIQAHFVDHPDTPIPQERIGDAHRRPRGTSPVRCAGLVSSAPAPGVVPSRGSGGRPSGQPPHVGCGAAGRTGTAVVEGDHGRRGRISSSAAFTHQATGTTGAVTRSAAPPWRWSKVAAIPSWGTPSGTALTSARRLYCSSVSWTSRAPR